MGPVREGLLPCDVKEVEVSLDEMACRRLAAVYAEARTAIFALQAYIVGAHRDGPNDAEVLRVL